MFIIDMKKILLMLLLTFSLVLIGCSEEQNPIDSEINNPIEDENNNPIDEEKDPNENKPIEIEIKNGTEVAKILLAQQRLDSNVLKNKDSIFTVGKEAFNTIIEKTRFYNRKYAGRPNETYTEVDGDTYKWYNDVDYSNFVSFFESYAEGIEESARRGAELIDYTKTYIRVVNQWVKQFDNEYLLIVNENSEVIINRYLDIEVNICKRYTDESGNNVYEMLYIDKNYITRMKYIPGLVYEYVTKPREENSYTHYLLADNQKGYWQVLSTGGIYTDIINGEKYEHNSMTYLVMKEEATYILNYLIDQNNYSYIYNIQVVSSDGKCDLLSMSLNQIELFNTGIKGLDHLEIVAPEDKVGDFVPNSEQELYVYEQENWSPTLGDYKIYSTSGHKSATAVCENGLTFTEGDTFLDGKVVTNRIDVNYVAGCDSYGRIPFITTANSLDEQLEILKELMDVTGFTFRRDYDTVISCLKYAIKDAENFSKYYTLNGKHINDLENIRKALEIEDLKFDDLNNIYNQVKDLTSIDIEDQETYNANIHFSKIEILEKDIINEEFKIIVNNIKVKVDDTLLFVDEKEYLIVFGLLIDDNIISLINEEDSKFKYTKGEEFILSQTKEIELPILELGTYTLVCYVATVYEGIRITEYQKLVVEVNEATKNEFGLMNTITNNEDGNLVIISKVDYNIYIQISDNLDYQQLENLLAQNAYDHGMILDTVIEYFDGTNWVVLNNDTTEEETVEETIEGEVTTEETPQDESKTNEETTDEVVDDNNESLDSETKYLEKGIYRMKYIANVASEDTNDYYIYITLE